MDNDKNPKVSDNLVDDAFVNDIDDEVYAINAACVLDYFIGLQQHS